MLFRSVGGATMDVVAGQIAMLLASVSILKPHVDNGRLRALAMSTLKRSAIAPELPTISETGLKGFEAKSWNSIVAPRNVPAAIVARMNADTNAVLNMPSLAEPLKAQGIEPEPGTPADLAAYIREEIVRFRKLVQAIGLKPE